MKLQYLTIVFLLIMTPIYLVFSKYIDTQIGNINIRNTYDARLVSATQDAVKAFQTNTNNSFKYIPETRVKFSKASVNSFFTSLNLAFGFNGEVSNLMKEYVPAVVLTMYDGYYIYAPFKNKLSYLSEGTEDEEYARDETRSDLKPYITYSCNYTKGTKKYIITYSLDNYIIVDEFEKGENKKHSRHEGYLIGLNQYNNVVGQIDYEHPEKITSLEFNGITLSNNTKERLKEYLVDKDGNKAFYYYTIRNGTKYYYGTQDANGNISFDDNKQLPDKINEGNTTDVIFYIDDNGNRIKQCENYNIAENRARFDSYYNEIKENTLGFRYYRNAYVFSNWVKKNLTGLKAGGTNTSIKNSVNYDGDEFTEIDDIFGEIDSNSQYIEDSDSNFNRHRRDIIRAVITTNLSAAISGFSTYSKKGGSKEFIMPKISEENWDLLENNSCIVTFLQGFPIGDKTYNSYAVVPNTKTKEFVDEDDIYVIKNDNTYARINENNYQLVNAETLGFQPAVWKTNFELKKIDETTFVPMSYVEGNVVKPYLESYSSIIGKDINTINHSDMYKYIRSGKSDNGTISIDGSIKKAYYVALGRERQGMFRFTNYDDMNS